MDEIQSTLEKLQIIQARLTGLLPSPARPFKPECERERAIVLYGPRGVGKTNFLLRVSRSLGGIYFSAEHPLLAGRPLHEWVEGVFEKGGTHVYIDEVHHAKDWALSLKTLYDDHPDNTIWVSGSDSLLLESGVSDLSRRYAPVRMPFLSFREFLVLNGLPDFGLHDPFSSDQSWAAPILSSINVLARFEEYLRFGTRPIFLEGENSYGAKVLQTIQKTIEADIPYLVASIQINHLHLMNAILGFLAQSPIPTLAVNSLCREWSTGKEKLYALIQALERTGVLHVVRRPSDHKAASIGAKVFFADPTLYTALAGQQGNVREAYVVSALLDDGKDIKAAPDETKADFLVDGTFSIEVGGPRKQRKSADVVVRDGTDWPAPGIVPLWTLGFMH